MAISNILHRFILTLLLSIVSTLHSQYAIAKMELLPGATKIKIHSHRQKRIYFSQERGIALARLSTDTHWTCNLSLFFSMEQNEQAALQPEAEGRGLLNCKNREGFQTDYPVIAEMKVEQTAELQAVLHQAVQNELTISMVSGQFSITREIMDVQDSYISKKLTSNVQNDLLMLGEHSQVAFNLAVTSRNRPISSIGVKSMKLHFDNEAPEIY